MKIYLSAITPALGYLPEDYKYDYVLGAFPELNNSRSINRFFDFSKDIFLDSGGFSIRNKGMDLSVVDYANFINQFSEHFTVIANMDTSSLEETLSNQKFLEQETKQKILPVYHRSDLKAGNINLLEEYCEKYDYIALGGVAKVKLSAQQKEYYLGKSFQIAMKHKTKIHGFGITNMKSLLRYPFYSVDSTSRMAVWKFNNLALFNNGKWSKIGPVESRNKFGKDLAKNPIVWKIRKGIEERKKCQDYIDRLHQAKGMEYRL